MLAVQGQVEALGQYHLVHAVAATAHVLAIAPVHSIPGPVDSRLARTAVRVRLFVPVLFPLVAQAVESLGEVEGRPHIHRWLGAALARARQLEPREDDRQPTVAPEPDQAGLVAAVAGLQGHGAVHQALERSALHDQGERVRVAVTGGRALGQERAARPQSLAPIVHVPLEGVAGLVGPQVAPVRLRLVLHAAEDGDEDAGCRVAAVGMAEAHRHGPVLDGPRGGHQGPARQPHLPAARRVSLVGEGAVSRVDDVHLPALQGLIGIEVVAERAAGVVRVVGSGSAGRLPGGGEDGRPDLVPDDQARQAQEPEDTAECDGQAAAGAHLSGGASPRFDPAVAPRRGPSLPPRPAAAPSCGSPTPGGH